LEWNWYCGEEGLAEKREREGEWEEKGRKVGSDERFRVAR
jgi:hypothetical protein